MKETKTTITAVDIKPDRFIDIVSNNDERITALCNNLDKIKKDNADKIESLETNLSKTNSNIDVMIDTVNRIENSLQLSANAIDGLIKNIKGILNLYNDLGDKTKEIEKRHDEEIGKLKKSINYLEMWLAIYGGLIVGLIINAVL